MKVYPISTLDVPELRDANYNMILATAIAAEVDVIVTGDDLRPTFGHRTISKVGR